MYPEDIDPMSGCRLPLPRREELGDAGQRAYDSLTDLEGRTIRGLRGPVVATTPISMIALRLQWTPKPPMQSMKVGPTASQRMSVSMSCSGALASTIPGTPGIKCLGRLEPGR